MFIISTAGMMIGRFFSWEIRCAGTGNGDYVTGFVTNTSSAAFA
jgi:hypothetical protein